MSTIKLKGIFNRNDENRLVLPDFQRDFVWDNDQQKKMLASFIISLPVGSILLLNGKKEDFANKKICFPKESCEPKDECQYLLDGQQRVTSLKSMFTDLFIDSKNWEKTWENIYKSLRNRWFIKLIQKDNEEDIFGYEMLDFKPFNSYEPSQVVGCIVPKTIYKSRTKYWFHPGFVVKDKNNKNIPSDEINKRNYYIAEYASKEGLVPLYTLYGTSGKALHEYVIEKIGRDKSEDLKARINDIKDVHNRDIEIKRYLERIQPNIDCNNKEEIDSAFNNLAAKWSRDVINYLEGILNQEVPTIELPANEINRAVAIFESINKGGTPLDTYDLVVAKAAKDIKVEALSKRLLDHLNKHLKINNALFYNNKFSLPRNEWFPSYVGLINESELSKTVKDQFLNMLSIFSNTTNVDNIKSDLIKSVKILELNTEQINKNAEKTINSLIRASAFLQIRCGIFEIKELQYELMLLPIAYCLTDEKIWANRKAINKIEYWYWSCLMGGAYRERQNEQCIKDIKALYKWVKGKGVNPFENYEKVVLNDPGYSDKNVLLMKDEMHEVPKAIRKALMQYILSNEPQDFIYEKIDLSAWKVGAQESCDFNGRIEILKLNDHHIFPLRNATKIGQSSKDIRKNSKHILNSPLNRTYISSKSNSDISDLKPEDYFQYVSKVAQFGHCIPDQDIEIYKNNTIKESELYESILKDRFDKIYSVLVLELNNLKS
ncbi:MAG TPA: hypothetical protein DCS12_07580 [Clostridiales bacterium]|nr:hypothetical protein [Clostridiales bacterium]